MVSELDNDLLATSMSMSDVEILFIIVFCLIIACMSCYYVYKWKNNNCYYHVRERYWCKCCHCKCSCDGSCDCWCCCINGCCPGTSISTNESTIEHFEDPGIRSERYDRIRSGTRNGGHEVGLRRPDMERPVTPAVTVQPLNDFEINRIVPDPDTNRQTAVRIDDLPTFNQALQMDVISTGVPTKKLMHQSSSKSDDLPPTYDAYEFHPVLLPGNTHYTYFDRKTVQPGTKM